MHGAQRPVTFAASAVLRGILSVNAFDIPDKFVISSGLGGVKDWIECLFNAGAPTQKFSVIQTLLLRRASGIAMYLPLREGTAQPC